jgi:hypothetical protein
MTKISNQYSLTNILTADLANSRLGINNVSPAYSLDLTGTARVTTSAYFATASGKLGIGTTTPTDKLEVQDGDLSTYHNANASTAGYGINFYTNGGGSKNSLAYIVLSQVGTARSGDLLFLTSNSGAPAERMRILANGNVGIGTSLPSGIVNGKGLVIYDANYPRLILQNTTTGTSTSAYSGMYLITSDLYIDNPLSNGNLIFTTNNSERMRITSGGNVLIGNTVYSADRLSVEGTANNWAGKFVGSTTSGQSFGIDIVAGTSSADYPLYVRTTNYSLRLYVRGDGVCYIGASSWVYNSDRRVKENISDVTNGLDLVSKLKPKHFDYIDGIKNNLGFIAQEVQELIPQAVTISDEKTGMLGLKTDFIVPYLTKAIQELSAENTSLINRIEALENK